MTAYADLILASAHAAYAAERMEEAATLLKLIIGAGLDDAQLLYLLGHIQHGQKRHAEAVVALRQSVLIDPTRAAAFNDLATALFALDRDAEGLVHIRRALDLDPMMAEAEETDSIWLLRYGRFAEGWRKYEARHRTAASHAYRRDFPQPQWRGEPIDGRTILLHAEQGLGDAVQFVRYAPLVHARGGRVILEVHAGMRSLMQGLPGVGQVLEYGAALPEFDLHCPLLSLPLAFGTTLDSIPASVPYLAVPEPRLSRWRARLGPRRALRIGVAWSGNPLHREDRRRSIPLARFARLLQPHPDREFHVLQGTIRPEDRAVLDTLPHVRDHTATPQDFTDAAALVALMDLVISVDTAIAHLAGALGWPVWLLLPAIADWRWLLERDDSPWYPTMSLFRQRTRDDWDSVLTEVAQRLDDVLS